MTLAAKKLTEQAEELEAAVTPRYTEEGLRGALASLQAFIGLDPRVAFGHSVREHHEAVHVLDSTIAALNVLGRHIMQDAKPYRDLAKALETAVPAACRTLRICRALAATLAGAPAAIANEPDEVRAELQRLLEERGAAEAARMDPEERAVLHDVREDSDLEAWLGAP